jgi:hypothetical protein
MIFLKNHLLQLPFLPIRAATWMVPAQARTLIELVAEGCGVFSLIGS